MDGTKRFAFWLVAAFLLSHTTAGESLWCTFMVYKDRVDMVLFFGQGLRHITDTPVYYSVHAYGLKETPNDPDQVLDCRYTRGATNPMYCNLPVKFVRRPYQLSYDHSSLTVPIVNPVDNQRASFYKLQKVGSDSFAQCNFSYNPVTDEIRRAETSTQAGVGDGKASNECEESSAKPIIIGLSVVLVVVTLVLIAVVISFITQRRRRLRQKLSEEDVDRSDQSSVSTPPTNQGNPNRSGVDNTPVRRVKSLLKQFNPKSGIQSMENRLQHTNKTAVASTPAEEGYGMKPEDDLNSQNSKEDAGGDGGGEPEQQGRKGAECRGPRDERSDERRDEEEEGARDEDDREGGRDAEGEFGNVGEGTSAAECYPIELRETEPASETTPMIKGSSEGSREEDEIPV